MSTKTTTQNQNTLQYDPGSKGNYDRLTGSATNVLTGYMNDPLGNPMFRLGSQFAQRGAAQQGNNNMNALTQNMLVSGMGGNAGAGFKMAQLGKIGRSNASMSSQANLGNIMQAFQRQLGAAGMGLSFNPLMTGTASQGTETKGGLGTWLPQLAGAAIGAGMNAFMPGAGSMMGMGGMGAMGAGSGSLMGGQALNGFMGRNSSFGFQPPAALPPPNSLLQ